MHTTPPQAARPVRRPGHTFRLSCLVAVALGAGLLALGLPGCASNSAEATTQPLLPAAWNPPIADVPIPRGFVMESQSSARVIPGSGLRFVDHYYKGHGDLLPVVRFYREKMPENGWTLTSQQQMPGEQFTLTYTKAHEDAIISVSKGMLDTHVRAQVMPSGRNAAK